MLDNSTRQLKNARGHVVLPRQHVCNGLTRLVGRADESCRHGTDSGTETATEIFDVDALFCP